MSTQAGVTDMSNKDLALKGFIIADKLRQTAVLSLERFFEDLTGRPIVTGNSPTVGILLTPVPETPERETGGDRIFKIETEKFAHNYS
jgi:hypothetical protein